MAIRKRLLETDGLVTLRDLLPAAGADEPGAEEMASGGGSGE